MPSRAGHLTVASRAVAFLCTIPLIIVLIRVQTFIVIALLVWISIANEHTHPHTDRQTHRQKDIFSFIYVRLIDE